MNEYKEADCCGADCVYLGLNDDQPCWGEVEVVDSFYGDSEEEDYIEEYIHVCEGHYDMYGGFGSYKPKPKD